MKKRAMLLIAMLVIGIGIVSGQAAPKPANGKKFNIVLIVKDLTNPFFTDMRDGGAAAAKKYGVDITCLSPEKYTVDAQIRIMEDMIEKKVDAIVIAPIDSNGIVSGVERANAAGIPVMACNTAILGGKLLGFAGIDEISSGKSLGEYFVKRLNGKGNIVILEGTTGSSTAQAYLNGVHEAIDKYPDIKVLASTTAKYNREMGMQVMEDLLTRFPDIDAALCMNDVMALGAKEAVQEARRKVLIGGINALPETLEAVKRGEIEVTVDASGYVQAYIATELTCKYLLTGEIPPAVTKIGIGNAQAISAANIDQFLKSRAK
ncbi:MAG: sugar ABC transporter substrate-binding protein [Rectinemataceae bacterium]